MQELIDGFDYEIMDNSNIMFDVELFKKLSLKVITNFHSKIQIIQ